MLDVENPGVLGGLAVNLNDFGKGMGRRTLGWGGPQNSRGETPRKRTAAGCHSHGEEALTRIFTDSHEFENAQSQEQSVRIRVIRVRLFLSRQKSFSPPRVSNPKLKIQNPKSIVPWCPWRFGGPSPFLIPVHCSLPAPPTPLGKSGPARRSSPTDLRLLLASDP